MVGDGSFVMLHSELLTAIQEGIKINICLFDNASFGCINNLQTAQGNDTLATELRYRTDSGKLDGAFMNVNYAKIAEAYGAKGYEIRTMDELEWAIEDAKKVEGPVLFDVKVLPKSMTDGYGAWWRVGTPEVSENERNRECWRDHIAHVKDARKY
jgi:3D-(3,5/4)-trihydroxycyclohexane-1,2-dione acylhydrolase (decyclizing)